MRDSDEAVNDSNAACALRVWLQTTKTVALRGNTEFRRLAELQPLNTPSYNVGSPCQGTGTFTEKGKGCRGTQTSCKGHTEPFLWKKGVPTGDKVPCEGGYEVRAGSEEAHHEAIICGKAMAILGWRILTRS